MGISGFIRLQIKTTLFLLLDFYFYYRPKQIIVVIYIYL